MEAKGKDGLEGIFMQLCLTLIGAEEGHAPLQRTEGFRGDRRAGAEVTEPTWQRAVGVFSCCRTEATTAWDVFSSA